MQSSSLQSPIRNNFISFSYNWSIRDSDFVGGHHHMDPNPISTGAAASTSTDDADDWGSVLSLFLLKFYIFVYSFSCFVLTQENSKYQIFNRKRKSCKWVDNAIHIEITFISCSCTLSIIRVDNFFLFSYLLSNHLCQNFPARNNETLLVIALRHCDEWWLLNIFTAVSYSQKYMKCLPNDCVNIRIPF